MKAIVIYFSHADENYNVGTVAAGNTKLLGDALATAIGADVFEITPETPYPTGYQECVEQATAERNEGARPAYVGDVANWVDYDTVYLGYPIWWGDLPMIVYTFLESHNWSGKTVVPFNTHEGSGNSGTFETIKNALPAANVIGDGWNISGKKARETAGQQELIEFVKSL